MIKLFRHIRQRLFKAGKFSNYAIYAFGEILLVVVGILIALEVNNRNEERIEAKKLHSYYIKLIEEADEQIVFTNELIDRNDSLLVMLRRTLEILASKDQALIPELVENIGSIATVWTNRYTLETFDEFSQQNLLTKVENPDLKALLLLLRDRMSYNHMLDNYIDKQYSTLIEPFFVGNINYSETALPDYKQWLIAGGPKIDFTMLFNSLQFWNIATFKLEITNSNLNNLEMMLNLFEDLKSKIEEEIQ